MTKHYLVRDTSASVIEKTTGLRAIDTPLGALVEEPRPFRLEVEMERLQRALHPRNCFCVVYHRPGCPIGYVCS